MGLLDKIAAFLTASGEDEDVYTAYVRCARCGEAIAVRVDLRHELTPQYGEGEAAYYVRKGVIGSGENRCFQTIDVELYFDERKRLVSREIAGGQFITEEAFTGTET
ncbi:MAG: hypothetical protein ACOC7N_04740 [Chloroflexota bacterium]